MNHLKLYLVRHWLHLLPYEELKAAKKQARARERFFSDWGITRFKRYLENKK